MADEMMKKADACDVPADELVLMRDAVAELQEKETVLCEKLNLAKEKGLTEQADRCRDLLRKVVRQRLKMQEELRIAEARQLAQELDALTEEIGAEFDPAPIPVEETEEYNYMAKSRRLSFLSKMIGFVGVFACFIGAFVYLLLAQVDTLNLPFEWTGLIVVGIGAVVFFVIALIIGASANKYKLIAEMLEAEREEENAILEAIAKEEAFTAESLDASAEAYALEKNVDSKVAAKKFLVKLPVEVPEKVKKNVHKIVPVAAVCTAIAAAFAVSAARKRVAAERHSAAVRRDFFKWLG